MADHELTVEEWQREVERLQRAIDWAALQLVRARDPKPPSSPCGDKDATSS